MAIAKVKLGLKDLTIGQRISLASQIVTAMTANPNFVTPNPSLADITTRKTALIAADNDADAKYLAAKDAVNLRNDLVRDMDSLLTQEASYVDNIANGNDNIIMSAGMSIRDARVPVGQLYPPLALSAMAGNNDGEIDLNWEPVRGANSYLIQMTTDPNVPDSWAFKANATESYAVILGLTSGNKYWFRVAGIGAAGQGAFSGAESKYAP
jgi:hypothetical protein